MHKALLYAISGLIVGCLGVLPSVQAFPMFEPKWTKVEQHFLSKSNRQPTYESEYFPVIEVSNSYELGRLTALRFIEWVQTHPNGVVAFTSGNTPEYFIKFLDFYKNNWRKADVQRDLRSFGINLKKFPDTSNLKLVQMEEIFPISERNYKKISNYTVRHYAKLLQIKPQNLLLMDADKRGIIAEKGVNVVFMNGKVDLSIMHRKATSQVELWQQKAIQELEVFCKEYEKKIRAFGGIDFFVGGLSYDSQLGFIQPETKGDSKTHIISLDNKTAAQIAKDVGGIDFVRGKVAMTIGLGTLSIKPNAVMIILAAGDAKANAVRNSVENQTNISYPASMLQRMPNSRIYVTDNATSHLDERQTADLRFKSKHGWIQKHYEQVITYISLAERKPILSLKHDDFNRHRRGRLLMENPLKPLNAMLLETHDSIVKKIEAGVKLNFGKGSKIMHTSPHHDDIVLGYYPLLDTFSKRYKNSYVYFTSGFNSVSDSYVLSLINRANDWWLDKEQEAILHKPYEKVLNNLKLYSYRQTVEQQNMQDTLLAMKSLVTIFDIKDIAELKHIIRWLKDDYFPHKQAGDLDIAQVKMLKSMIRESESDRLSLLKNIPLHSVVHMRSKFYSGREFMRTPRYDADIAPFIKQYNKFKPDMLTVLDDPDSTPPITNYRVLQIIAQALRSSETQRNDNLQIIGYRNIWFKYELADTNSANILVPVSSQMLAAHLMAYNTCFNSQKRSTFPSPFFDGDFAALADTIQREQLAELKVLLGTDYFARNAIADIREAAGFIYLNQMNLNEFFRRVSDLQPLIDLEEAYIASKK